MRRALAKRAAPTGESMLRWISGIILAFFLVCLLLWGSPFLIKGIVVLVAAVAMDEFLLIAGSRRKFLKHWVLIGIVFIATGYFVFLAYSAEDVLRVLAASLGSLFILQFGGKDPFEKRVVGLGYHFIGFFYIVLLFTHVGWALGLPHYLFWIFLLLACSDTGAYIAGHQWGRHKLAPLLSPGKTVEGFVGGLVASIVAAFIVRAFFYPGYPLSLLVLVALLVGIIGPVGDLSESFLKRGFGVKDSGNLIPGHGGILDRLDALLFAAPAVYYFARYFG